MVGVCPQEGRWVGGEVLVTPNNITNKFADLHTMAIPDSLTAGWQVMGEKHV